MGGIRPTADALARDATTSLRLVEECLARIDDPWGEGPQTFIRRFDAQARSVARGWDVMRQAGAPLPRLAGIPISVKDLCDVAGSVTTAGSVALRDAPPATIDAPILARLRSAGAVILGTTNMTEFAMGTPGLNPHYGTPRNPFDRETGLIPGGSSSGAAISVTDGMAIAAIGSDTAGSIRVPAAFCGLVGFKPTARRVPLAGTLPLAPTFDSIGPLGLTVDCCARLDAVLAGCVAAPPPPLPLAGLRLGLPTRLVLDDLEPTVAAAFSQSLTRLSEAGLRIIDIRFDELAQFAELGRHGGFSVVEGFAWHRSLLAKKQALYDPFVAHRFLGGAGVLAADYIAMLALRRALIESCAPVTRAFDAILMPTAPITAPPIAALRHDEEKWLATNRLLTRSTGIANTLDRCAITLPCHAPGTAPVGLTLMGQTMGDRRLLSIAFAVEAALAQS